MSYVQKFQPRGNDLESLRIFLRSKLSEDVTDPADQAMVAQKAYDIARAAGRDEGAVSTADLNLAYESLAQSGQIGAPVTAAAERSMSQQQPIDQIPTEPMQTEIPEGAGAMTRYRGVPSPADFAGHLLPRTAMQSGLESRRSVRHLTEDDQTADAIGAYVYNFVDSATLGLIGGIGGILRKLGATDENFWTETIGRNRNFFGSDVGEGGIKEGDTTAGLWGAALGELTGFMAPVAGKVAAKPVQMLARGAIRGSKAAKAAQLTKAASGAGEVAPQMARLIKMLKGSSTAAELATAASEAGVSVSGIVRAEKAMEGAARVGSAAEKVWEFAPASFVFKGGHKMLNRFFIGEAATNISAKVMANAFRAESGGMRLLDKLLPNASRGVMSFGDDIARYAGQAAEEASKAGYGFARQQGSKVLVSSIENGVYNNTAVASQARNIFQARFMELVSKNTHLGRDSKRLFQMTEHATSLFDDAFNAARANGGMLTLAERAARSGSSGLSLGLLKFVEEAANHSTGMVLLGLTHRLMAPIAEPEIYGTEDMGWKDTAAASLKYWVRGNPEGNPMFEGILGDVWVGSMFATGGFTKLLSPFQRARVKSPKQALAIALGETEGVWGKVLDETDRILGGIYRSAPRQGAGFKVREFLKRNKVDFRALTDAELATISNNYLGFLERGGGKAVPSLANSALPFTARDIALLKEAASSGTRTPAAQQARALVEEQLGKHLDHVLGAYRRGVLGDLGKDLASFALTASATAYFSSPELFKAYGNGEPGIHISNLVTHSIFSMMAARHPYYLPDATGMMGKSRAAGEGFSQDYINEVRRNGIRDGLRRLGIRDADYFDSELTPALEAVHDPSLGPRESTTDSNRIAEKIEAEWAAAQAEGRPPSWNNFEVVNDIRDVTDPTRQVTKREVEAFISYIATEGGRGQDLHPMYTQVASDGSPLLTSREIYTWSSDNTLQELGTISGGTLFKKMVAGAIEMRSRMTERGLMEEGQEMHGRVLHRGNANWNRNFVNGLRKLLGDSREGSGVLRYLRKAMGDADVTEYLRKISLVEKVDGATVAAEGQRDIEMVKAWNELVDLSGDFGLGVNTKEGPLEIRIDSPEKVDLVQGIGETISWIEGEINKAGGIEGKKVLKLGEGTTHRAAIEALITAKTDDSTFFLREGGVLRDSEGNRHDVEDVLDMVVDAGVAIRDGIDVIIKKYNLSKIENLQKRRKIGNLLRWLSQHERVRKSTGAGDETPTEVLESLLNANMKSLGGSEKVAKSVFDSLDEMGLPMHSSAMVDNMVYEAAKQKYAELKDTDFMFVDFIRDNGLRVDQGTGPRFVMPVLDKDADQVKPLPFKDMGVNTEGYAHEEKPVSWSVYDVEDIAKSFSIGDNLKFAFQGERYDTIRDIVDRVSRAGLLDGFATDKYHPDIADPAEGQGYVAYYKSSDATALREFAQLLDYTKTRNRAEIETDVAASLAKLHNDVSTNKRFSPAQRRAVGRLLTAMNNTRKYGGWAYARVIEQMVDSGTLEIGEGFKKKQFVIKSTEDIIRDAERIESFLDAAGLAGTMGQFSESRLFDPEAREAFEYMQRGGASKTSPSAFFSSLSVDSPIGKTKMVDVILDNHRNAEGGAIGTANYASTLRDRIRSTLAGASTPGTSEVAVNRLAEYTDIEIMAVAQSLVTSKEFYSWKLREGEISSTETMSGKTRIEDTAYTNRVESVRAPRKFWGSLSDLAPVHFINHMVPRRSDGKDVDMYVDAKIREDVERRLLTIGVDGAMSADNGMLHRIGQDQKLRMVLMPRASEEGGMWAMQLPTAEVRDINGELTDRGRMSQELNRIIDAYSDAGRENVALNDALDAARAYRDVLDGDGSLEKFYSSTADLPEYGNKVRMMKTIAELITYDRMFGKKLVIASLSNASNPHYVNEMSKLKSREKLATADSIQNADPIIAQAVARDFMDGRNLTLSDMDKRGGFNVSDGRITGIRTAIYEDEIVGARKKRGVLEGEPGTKYSPETDSAVWVTPEVLNYLHHLFGRDGVDQSFGVGKIKLFKITGDGDIIGTKDALFQDPEITKMMRNNGVGMIMSRSAAKLLSGVFGDESSIIKFADGEIDIKAKLDGTSKFDGTKSFEIPIDAIDWQSEVDHNPKSAVIAANLSNYKDPDVMKGLADRFFGRSVSKLHPTWERMFGNSFDPRANSMIREFMMHRMQDNDADAMDIKKRGWQVDYLTRGGAHASPNHYGMHQHVLAVAMRSFINDSLFKGRSEVGTHAVYSPDIYDEVKVGQAVLPLQARGIKLDSQSLRHLTFSVFRDELELRDGRDLLEGEISGSQEIENEMNTYRGWAEKGKAVNFNTRGAGENVPEHMPSYNQSVNLMEKGSKGGIAPGLMQFRRSANGGAAVGASHIQRLMRGVHPEQAEQLAGAINNAYQEIVMGESLSTGQANARAALMKAFPEGKVRTATGSFSIEDVIRDVTSDLSDVWSMSNGTWVGGQAPNRTIGTMMDGLSHIFGEYKYGSKAATAVGFGLVAGGQRNPQSMPNDLMPLTVRGFLGKEYGQQVKMHMMDAERIMKADFDKDEINLWFDNPSEVMSGLERIRGVSGGLHEPTMPKVEGFKPFTSQTEDSTHMMWVERFREGKRAIGIIQRTVNIVSNMIVKGIAFRYRDPETGYEYLVEPLSTMDGIQNKYQSNMLEMADQANRFFDVKHGVPVQKLSDMDLQADVLRRFYTMRRVTKDTTGERKRDVGDETFNEERLNDHAIEVLKASMTLFGNMASVTSKGSKAGESFADMARHAARYSLVTQGGDVKNKVRNHTKIALALGHPELAGKVYAEGYKELTERQQGAIDDKVRKSNPISTIMDSIEVVDPSFSRGQSTLGNRTILDTISDGIRLYADSVEKGYERSYMSALERKVTEASLDLSTMFDETLQAARGQSWVLAMDDQPGTIEALRRSAEYGEGHLAYEAAMAESFYKQYKFSAQRVDERKFGEKQRWQPSNGLEEREALGDTVDAMAIKLARSMVDDQRPEQARARFARAEEIREVSNKGFRQIYSAGPYPKAGDMNQERLEAILDAEIYAYMQEFGKGNEAAALLDLVALDPNGFYYARGSLMGRYKKFPQMLWRIGVKYATPTFGAQPSAVRSPEGYDQVMTDVYGLMAEANAMIRTSLNGDRHGFQQVRSWIEAQSVDGQSFVSALNTSKMGGSAKRFSNYRDNIRQALANRELSERMNGMEKNPQASPFEGDGEFDPFYNDGVLGWKTVNDAVSFINRVGLDPVKYAKIHKGKQAVGAGIYPNHLTDNISGADVLIMKSGTIKPDPKPGFWESRTRRSMQEEVYEEESAKRKEARDKGATYEKPSRRNIEDMVANKERELLKSLLQTLDARNFEVPMPREGFDGSSAVDHELEMRFRMECF